MLQPGNLLLYLCVGMFLDGIVMLLLTVPLVLPPIHNRYETSGTDPFNPSVFGVLVVRMTRISLGPPPVCPPALPAMAAAMLGGRPTWWIGTVISTTGGLALIVFARHRLLKGLGVALLLAPHAVGAPQPGQFGGKVPGELAAEFAVASLFTAALFWTALGGIAGYFHRKIS